MRAKRIPKERETAELRARLKSFREITLKIASSGNLAELFEVIISNLGSSVPFDHVSMVLVEPHSNRYCIPVAADFDTDRITHLEGKTINPSDTFISNVIAGGQTVYRPDIERSVPLYPHCRKLLEKGILSDLLIPLKIEDRCIGTLNIASRRQDPFRTDHISFCEDIALQVAVAVNKCELFESLRKSKEEVELYSRTLEQMVDRKTDELKAAHEKLLINERFASIGHLGASLGHELRNPLGVIKNVSYYLSRRLGHGEEKIQRQIAILDREITKAERIINNLLNFSRNRAPEFVLSDLSTIVAQALGAFRFPSAVTVVTRFDPDLPKLHIDRGEIEQVFQNLIQNSIEAMREGGELILSAGRVRGLDEVRIEVTDTGVGIRADDVERIFEPLYTTRRGGIGLGLALVKSIIHRHKGRIEVRSIEGQGTTFAIWLPVGGAEKRENAIR
jgi:signal transduction histidine kinase